VIRNGWTKDTITDAAAYSMIDVEPLAEN